MAITSYQRKRTFHYIYLVLNDKIGPTLVMTGDYGIVARSTDGGVTWSSNNFLLSTSLMFDVQTLPGSPKVWVVGRPFASTTRQIFYSSNSGDNWTTYDLGITGDFLAITMINQQTGYISGQNSKILKTTNLAPVAQPGLRVFRVLRIS